MNAFISMPHGIAGCLLTLALLSLPLSAGALPPEAVEAERLVNQLTQATAAVRDYTAVLTKQQRIRGTLRPIETIALKHRREPECRYLKWLPGPNENRQILHCANRDDGKMKVREGGFLGLVTISLDPHGKRAKRDDLRPITETGIYSIAAFTRADHAHHLETGDTRVQILKREVHGQPATCIATPGGTELTPAYAASAREVCVHDELGLPVEVRAWNQADELMEHYTFRDFRINPGLGDADFDPAHPDYRF
jgi:hypothetical protein